MSLLLDLVGQDLLLLVDGPLDLALAGVTGSGHFCDFVIVFVVLADGRICQARVLSLLTFRLLERVNTRISVQTPLVGDTDFTLRSDQLLVGVALSGRSLAFRQGFTLLAFSRDARAFDAGFSSLVAHGNLRLFAVCSFGVRRLLFRNPW